MKKTFLSIALVIGLIGVTTIANAQNGRFSVGAELGLPLGGLGDAQSMGFGGSVRYEHPIGDNIGLTGTAGYLIFSGKDQTFDFGPLGSFTFEGPDLAMIPIQAGLKYYFSDNQDGFYGQAEVGVHISSYSISGSSSSSTDLSYAPGIGYHLANIDIGLRYQLISYETTVVDPITFESVSGSSTEGYLGLRIAYVFGEQ